MSKYKLAIPPDLQEIFNKIDNNEWTFDVGNEINLLELRIYDLLRNDDYPVMKVWQELKKQWRTYESARRKGDIPKAQDALSQIGLLVDKGYISAWKWAEIKDLMDTRRKMIDTNTKNELAKQEMVSMEIVNQLILNYGKKVTDIIKLHVPDRDTQALIADAIIEVEIE